MGISARRTPGHEKSDGAVFEAVIYSRALRHESREAALVAVFDITERKQLEDELYRTKEFLNTVVENVPATIIVKEARGDYPYVLVNRAGEEFLGMSRDRILGKTVYDLFPKAAADRINARDELLLTAGNQLYLDDQPMHLAANAPRVVTARRLVVRSKDGAPQYLLTVIDDATERRLAEQRIAHMAHHDSLTDLPNRAAFNEHLAATFERASACGESFTVMCIDLDRFKEVNDVFGHSTGDALLCEVARRLCAVAGHVFIARLGGDEFVAVVPAGSQPSTVEELADRLLVSVANDIVVGGHSLQIDLSIGIAVFPIDGSDATTLLGNADAALYRAKQEGRGAVRFFTAAMDRQLRERRALQHDLRSAIEHGELRLEYQPQAFTNGEIIGFEALARWRHPKWGPIPPAQFIPIAEDSGLIVEIGEWVLREACREAASWVRPVQVAVNVSVVQFRRGNLPALVHSILLETGLPPDRLELEITEGVLIENFSRAASMLRGLKALGVRIALDDFGTGYSSLSYLQSFPLDRIKIDRSFISSLDRSEGSLAIVRAVIGLAHGFNLPVLAEGVETDAQLAILAREQCDGVQGYLIGRPGAIGSYAHLTGRGASPASMPALASA